MTTPTPGWLPDPTGRHEYRYWDGSRWCDDVSDGGSTTFDPIAATPPQAGPEASSGYGQPSGSYGSASGPYGDNPYAPQPQHPPSSGSGPSTGLLIGLGVLLAVLVVGIVIVVTSGGDDDDNDAETAGDTETTGANGSDEGGNDSGGGDVALTDAIAEGIVSSADGALTEEQGQCIAQGMIDELGADRIVELGLDSADTADPFSVLDSEEQTAVVQAILDCVPAETLAEIGADPAGG